VLDEREVVDALADIAERGAHWVVFDYDADVRGFEGNGVCGSVHSACAEVLEWCVG
jgi:hypothetical protein